MLRREYEVDRLLLGEERLEKMSGRDEGISRMLEEKWQC